MRKARTTVSGTVAREKISVFRRAYQNAPPERSSV